MGQGRHIYKAVGGLSLGGDRLRKRALNMYSQLSEKLDLIVLMNDIEPSLDLSFFYVTGLESGLFEGCVALIRPDGEMTLLVSALEETSARSSEAEVKVFRKMSERDQMLRELLGGARSVGINGSALTYRNAGLLQNSAPHADFMDVWKQVESARMVKDAQEIENMRQAGRIASRVAEEIPDFLRGGMTENEASAEINYRMQKKGASAPAFDTIAAFGKGSAEPHYSPSDVKLEKGQMALFDFGARFKRYSSDLTRTYFLSWVPPKFQRMYEIVLEAQEEALKTIRAGANGSEVDAAARSVIESSEFGLSLIHSVGHSLGMAAHDGGRMAQNVDLVLRENMVVTVEPGMYIPGEGGIRIEDDVRVTSSGYEFLTNAKKKLTVI